MRINLKERCFPGSLGFKKASETMEKICERLANAEFVKCFPHAFLDHVIDRFYSRQGQRLVEGCEELSNPIPRIICDAVLGNCHLILGLGPSRTRNTKPPLVNRRVLSTIHCS